MEVLYIMPKKNIDLSEYSIQDSNSTQAKSKYSAFIENEETQDNVNVPEPKSDTSTVKEKRDNMAFSNANYEFLLSETSKLGVNFMYFLNHIISTTSNEDIDTFMDNHPLLKGGRSSAPRRRGFHMKRINFKISADNHKKLRECASKHNATITAIVNAILEIYKEGTK